MKWIGLIISFIGLSGLIALFWKFIGYRRAYFLVAFLTVLVFVMGFFYGAEIEKLNPIVQDILMYSIIDSPIALFALSVRNLYANTTVPRIFSIANIVLSIGMILVLIVAIMSGVSASMIG